MLPALRRATLAATAAALLLGSGALPVAARRPVAHVPSAAAIRAAGGRLVAVDRSGARTRFVTAQAPRGREAQTALQLAAQPGVVDVVVDRTVQPDGWPADGAPDDPLFVPYQAAGFALTDVAGAWRTTRGAGTTVAVLDTGANLGHPDLAGLHVAGTWNALDGSANVADGNGHGTHVLGTLAATADNGTGVAGVAPAVDVLVVKVIGDNGSGSFSALANGIEWAIAHGATVISMSLGASGTADMFAGFAYAADDAWRAGVLLVAAGGNTGDARLHFPACWAHVVGVASVDDAGRHSSFSTTNACIDLAAPGEGIASLGASGGYVAMTGTSMATPQVAGVAALVRAAAPGLGPDDVAAVLQATALDRGARGRDDAYGAGVVRAGRAVAGAIGTRGPLGAAGRLAPPRVGGAPVGAH